MIMQRESTRTVAIVQARLGSSRLPGKTLAIIEGQPLLAWILTRVQASKTIDELILATTTEPEDNVLLQFAQSFGIRAYAGSRDDVLDRFYQAAKFAHADFIVRITADDPFKDPDIIDLVVSRLHAADADYASNAMTPSYPEGLDVEVFSFESLKRAWHDALLASEREHVTPYIWKNRKLFRLVDVRNPIDLSHLRWTLDYEEDLTFAREIYARLAPRGIFLMNDILQILEAEPALANINRGCQRAAGYLLSLSHDTVLNPRDTSPENGCS